MYRVVVKAVKFHLIYLFEGERSWWRVWLEASSWRCVQANYPPSDALQSDWYWLPSFCCGFSCHFYEYGGRFIHGVSILLCRSSCSWQFATFNFINQRNELTMSKSMLSGVQQPQIRWLTLKTPSYMYDTSVFSLFVCLFYGEWGDRSYSYFQVFLMSKYMYFMGLQLTVQFWNVWLHITNFCDVAQIVPTSSCTMIHCISQWSLGIECCQTGMGLFSLFDIHLYNSISPQLTAHRRLTLSLPSS